MATEGGGKIKTKRNQPHSKPYERNSTLFGKLKNSLKDLLIPSWLARSSPDRTSQGNEETQLNAQVSVLPSSSTVTSGNNIGFVMGSESSDIQHRSGSGISHSEQTAQVNINSERPSHSLSGVSGQAQSSNNLIGEPYMDATYSEHAPNVNIASLDKQNSNWRSKRADLPHTSNLSRLHQTKYQPQSRNPTQMSDTYLDETHDQEVETPSVRPILISTRSPKQSLNKLAPDSKRQHLWSPESARQGKPLEPPITDRPAFNSLLFGSPIKKNSSLLGDSFRESSFYSGKTCFGGASAERRASFNSSLPYQSSLPLRKQVKASKLNSSLHATTSATAQRILETLDRMSTPLGDARKIPQVNDTANDSVLSFTPSSYRRSSLMRSGRPITRPLQLPNKGPPITQHQALSQAVIAKNRQKAGIVSQRQESMDVPAGLTVSQEPSAVRDTKDKSFPQDSQGGLTQAGGSGLKMKSKRFSQHISSSRGTDDEDMEVPNLRTDFTLPITKINPISLSSKPDKSHTVVAASSIPSSDRSVPLTFTFSTPIEKRCPAGSQVPDTIDKGFKFSFPIKASLIKTSGAGAEEGSKSCPEPAVGASSGVSFQSSSAAFSTPIPAWGSTAPKPKASSPDIGGTSSSFKSYNKWSSFSKNSDISAASDEASSGGFGVAPAVTLKTGSVMDILGAGKSSPSIPPPLLSTVTNKEAVLAPQGTDDLMAKFKKPPGTWECPTCMIINKSDAIKCVACETPKPGAKPAAVSVPSPEPTTSTLPSTSGTDDLMAKFKKPPGTWECTSCMIHNKPEDVKCVACETMKPGAKQTFSTAGASSNSSLSALFKKPPGNWECDTCMVQNSATAQRCIACDTPKPGLQLAGIVTKPLPNSGSTAISISPSGGFTINLPATTTTVVGSGGFKFGNTNSSSTVTTSTPVPGGFIFGQSSSSNKDLTGQSASNSQQSSLPLSAGFKFGMTTTVSDSGGSESAPKVSSGFVFGSTFPGSESANSKDNTSSAFHAGGIVTSASSNGKSGSNLSDNLVNNSQPGSLSNGNFTQDSNKSSNTGLSTGGFQFGITSNTVVPSLGGSVLPLFGTDSKASETNTPQQPKVNFNVSSTFTMATSVPQLTSKTDSTSAAKPASGLFQFGASTVSSSTASIGLGMGQSLSDSKPVVNGGFGSGMETTKDISKPASQDTNKSGGFTFNSSAPAFGSFGQASSLSSSSSVSSSVVPTRSQPGKHSVDFGEMDAPSAKKSFAFGMSNNEPPVNGLFTFGGSTESKSSSFGGTGTNAFAVPSTGGFNFGSNQSGTPAAAPALAGGFQFSTGTIAPSASAGLNFTVKTPNEAPKPSFEMTGNKGSLNFNFGGAPQPSNTPFQFAAKPIENSAPAPVPGVFTFAAVPPTGFTSDTSGFNASPGNLGSFSVGTADMSGRKVKKAARRLKK